MALSTLYKDDGGQELMPKFDHIKKVLLLGSGALKIGEAGEFDYSGSQALKALKEEGIETVLINPNVATIQTDTNLAGKVYLLPVLPKYVTEVIKKERPDGILLGFGGQTSLNCGVQLAEQGVFDKYDVEVLGTPIKGIQESEDRELFRLAMDRANAPVPKSRAANSVAEALAIADEISFPIIVRPAYTLGGKGSGVARNEYELEQIAKRGLSLSRIHQVLIEEYLDHWKEVEYEVMRDYDDNCITICNMENFDPLGVHTGESIVIAPSQTLTNREYNILRSASIRVIRSLGVVGECNVQFGLDAKSEEYRVIEVNARLSRSSALASKATGYPLAYIAAKLAVGYTLPELKNVVTGITTACFEPALDYLVVKIPRWDLPKFERVDRHIGTQMKSVGEVMAIGRCFEEGIQKAIRMLDIGKWGIIGNGNGTYSSEEVIEDALIRPTDERLYVIVDAFKRGYTVEKIYKLSGIDPWFLYKIKNIIDLEVYLRHLDVENEAEDTLREVLKEAKRLGFSDLQLSLCLNISEKEVRSLRRKHSIIPVINQIDTLAAEWPAHTNYLYLTYGGSVDDITASDPTKKNVVVLGCGSYRIGSSVEFDWTTMNMVWGLKTQGFDESVVVNYNPETVSTDFDMSDRLYFDEITLENVLEINEKEHPAGVVVSVGGQIPNTLAHKLWQEGVPILGTAAEDIDRAEDRSKFSALLDTLGIMQPSWKKLTTLDDAKEFARDVSYPVLVRPSYVLSGAAMRVAFTENELISFLKQASSVSQEYPVVISKFIRNAKEVEVDAVSDGKDVFIGAIIEHIERAGVHSGDATMSIPPLTLSTEITDKIKKYTLQIARALRILGPFNIQYLVKNGDVLVIECNLRSSRSMPFVSKARGVNLMEISAGVLQGKTLRELSALDTPPIDFYVVKTPQFSFTRLTDADPILGVEMRSTGEVACFGETFGDALIKSLEGAEFKLPMPDGNVFITVGGLELKQKLVPIAKKLKQMGYNILATEDTAEYFEKAGLSDVETLYKISEQHRKPNILEYLINQKIDLVINIPQSTTLEKYSLMLEDEYAMRRKAVEFGIPILTTVELSEAFVDALSELMVKDGTILSLNEYHSDGKEKIKPTRFRVIQ